MNPELIEAGKIINTHGISGQVKIEVWLDNAAFLKKYKTMYICGKKYNVLSAFVHKNFLIASLEGIADMNSAESMKEKVVYVSKTEVPLPKGRFFLQDILQFTAVNEAGETIGVVTGLLETPAANILEITDSSGIDHLIPAVDAFLKSVDPDKKIITIHMIEGL